MKKTLSSFTRMLFPGAAGLLLVLTILSCGTKDNAGASAESAGDDTAKSSDCLGGKWSVMENNVEKSFTFNDDHTGQEVNTPEDIRAFKWEKKDDKQVAILYIEDPSNKEWTLNLDCDAGTLSFFGLAFKK